MASMTNCVNVRLSAAALYGASTEAMCLLAIRTDLESFGEIAQAGIKKVNDWQQVVQAVYYDIRSAKAAAGYFGDLCEFGPQEGSLLVTVPKVVFQGLAFEEVANVTCLEGGDFEVEFFDTRAAARVAEMAACTSLSEDDLAAQSTCDSLGIVDEEQQSEASTEEDLAEPMSVACAASEARPSGENSGPRRIGSFHLSQIRWQDFAAEREWRTALLLRGLPSSLCLPGRLEGLLKHHGLGGVVSSVRVPRSLGGRSIGYAVVTATSVKEVPAVAKFFHGRLFGRMPVAVSFAPVQSASGRMSAASVVTSSSTAAAAAGVGPVKLRQTLSLSSCLEFSEDSASVSSGSPCSTESPCSDDEASPARDPCPLAPPPGLALPAGLMPPPGLETTPRSDALALTEAIVA